MKNSISELDSQHFGSRTENWLRANRFLVPIPKLIFESDSKG